MNNKSLLSFGGIFLALLITLSLLLSVTGCDINSPQIDDASDGTTNSSQSDLTVMPDDSDDAASAEDFIADNVCEDCLGASDPYTNTHPDDFYRDYEPACCNLNASYRTKHGFMSGVITPQDQNATIANDRPLKDGSYIKNTSKLYSEDGNTYTVLSSSGDVAYYIFKDGAYVSLDEVAAYVFAFGDIPPNYISKKSATPSTSKWGEYLRLNHSYFSCNTSKYPYEPALPNSQGTNAVSYYEIDIGTTGTDCDPKYTAALYNNGTRITRGAARIVYARFDANGDSIIEPCEKYVFYTNNHYNDFREYLNYSGGWGEIFGNITGGGTISSNTDYNPTPYIPILNADITKADRALGVDKIGG